MTNCLLTNCLWTSQRLTTGKSFFNLGLWSLSPFAFAFSLVLQLVITMWHQTRLILPAYSRGFHLITREILAAIPEIEKFEVGMLQVFIQHTSASLTINENADSSVRTDFESHINIMVPENTSYYTFTYEGSDDMPAHIKSSLLGTSV